MLPATTPATPAAAFITDLEERLRQAQLTGNADALAELLADDLVFLDQQGRLTTKEEDLATHRARLLQLTTARFDAPEVRLLPAAAVVVVRAELAGTYAGQAIAGTFRYLRVWAPRGERWQVVAGSVSSVGAE